MNEPEAKCLEKWKSLVAAQIEKARGRGHGDGDEEALGGRGEEEEEEAEDAGDRKRRRSSSHDSVFLSSPVGGPPLRLWKTDPAGSPSLWQQGALRYSESEERSRDCKEILTSSSAAQEAHRQIHLRWNKDVAQPFSPTETSSICASSSQSPRKRKAPLSGTDAECSTFAPQKVFIVPATVEEERQKGKENSATVICSQKQSPETIETPRVSQNVTELSDVSQNAPGAVNDTPDVSQNAPESMNDTPDVSQNAPESMNDVPEVSQATSESVNDTPDVSQNAPESMINPLDVPQTTSESTNDTLDASQTMSDTSETQAKIDVQSEVETLGDDVYKVPYPLSIFTEHPSVDGILPSNDEDKTLLSKSHGSVNEPRVTVDSKACSEVKCLASLSTHVSRSEIISTRGAEVFQTLNANEEIDTGVRENSPIKEKSVHASSNITYERQKKKQDNDRKGCVTENYNSHNDSDASHKGNNKGTLRCQNKMEADTVCLEESSSMGPDEDYDCDFIYRLLSPIRNRHGQVSLFHEIEQAEQQQARGKVARVIETGGRLPHPPLRMTQVHYDSVPQDVEDTTIAEKDEDLVPQISSFTLDAVQDPNSVTESQTKVEHCKTTEKLREKTDCQPRKEASDCVLPAASNQHDNRQDVKAVAVQTVDWGMLTSSSHSNLSEYEDLNVSRADHHGERKQANKYGSTEKQVNSTILETSLLKSSPPSYEDISYASDPFSQIASNSCIAQTSYLPNAFHLNLRETCLYFAMDNIVPAEVLGSLPEYVDNLMLSNVGTVVGDRGLMTIDNLLTGQYLENGMFEDDPHSTLFELDSVEGKNIGRLRSPKPQYIFSSTVSRTRYSEDTINFHQSAECLQSPEQLAHCLLTLNNNSLPSQRRHSASGKSTSGLAGDLQLPSVSDDYLVEYNYTHRREHPNVTDRNQQTRRRPIGPTRDLYGMGSQRRTTNVPRHVTSFSAKPPTPREDSRISVTEVRSSSRHPDDCKCLEYDCLRKRGEMLHSHVMKNLDVLKQFAADHSAQPPNYSIHIKEAVGNKARDLIKRQKSQLGDIARKGTPMRKFSGSLSSLEQTSVTKRTPLSASSLRSTKQPENTLKKGLSLQTTNRMAQNEAKYSSYHRKCNTNQRMIQTPRTTKLSLNGCKTSPRSMSEVWVAPQRSSAFSDRLVSDALDRLYALRQSDELNEELIQRMKDYRQKPWDRSSLEKTGRNQKTNSRPVQTNPDTPEQNCNALHSDVTECPVENHPSTYFFSVEVPCRMRQRQTSVNRPRVHPTSCKELSCETKHIVTKSGQETVTQEWEKRQFNPSSKRTSSYFYCLSQEQRAKRNLGSNREVYSADEKPRPYNTAVSTVKEDSSNTDHLPCGRDHASSETQTLQTDSVTVAVQTSPSSKAQVNLPPLTQCTGADVDTNASLAAKSDSVGHVPVEHSDNCNVAQRISLQPKEYHDNNELKKSTATAKKKKQHTRNTESKRTTAHHGTADATPSAFTGQHSTSSIITQSTPDSAHSLTEVTEEDEVVYFVSGERKPRPDMSLNASPIKANAGRMSSPTQKVPTDHSNSSRTKCLFTVIRNQHTQLAGDISDSTHGNNEHSRKKMHDSCSHPVSPSPFKHPQGSAWSSRTGKSPLKEWKTGTKKSTIGADTLSTKSQSHRPKIGTNRSATSTSHKTTASQNKRRHKNRSPITVKSRSHSLSSHASRKRAAGKTSSHHVHQLPSHNKLVLHKETRQSYASSRSSPSPVSAASSSPQAAASHYKDRVSREKKPAVSPAPERLHITSFSRQKQRVFSAPPDLWSSFSPAHERSHRNTSSGQRQRGYSSPPVTRATSRKSYYNDSLSVRRGDDHKYGANQRTDVHTPKEMSPSYDIPTTKDHQALSQSPPHSTSSTSDIDPQTSGNLQQPFRTASGVSSKQQQQPGTCLPCSRTSATRHDRYTSETQLQQVESYSIVTIVAQDHDEVDRMPAAASQSLLSSLCKPFSLVMGLFGSGTSGHTRPEANLSPSLFSQARNANGSRRKSSRGGGHILGTYTRFLLAALLVALVTVWILSSCHDCLQLRTSVGLERLVEELMTRLSLRHPFLPPM